MPHPSLPFSSPCSIFFLSFIKRPHTYIYTHRLPRSHWLEYVSWWPRQVTDGDLTALLTVNWVLIKPKHVWEMLIIHCRLRRGRTLWLLMCVSSVCYRFLQMHYYSFMALQLRSTRQDGLGVSSVPGYSSPKAVSLTKINIDENLSNSYLGVLKQTLQKWSSGICNCLLAYLPKIWAIFDIKPCMIAW